MSHARPVAVLDRHRTETRDVSTRYDLYNPCLFGSFARGEANPSSDIDILAEPGLGVSLFDLAGAEIELSDLLGRDVQITTTNRTASPFLQRIAPDLRPL